MNASTIRKQAEALSEQRAQAQADAEGYESLVAFMSRSGYHGKLIIDEMIEKQAAAERRLDELAEAEGHAWDAYTDASQAEHEQMLAEQAQDYPTEDVYGYYDY